MAKVNILPVASAWARGSEMPKPARPSASAAAVPPTNDLLVMSMSLSCLCLRMGAAVRLLGRMIYLSNW